MEDFKRDSKYDLTYTNCIYSGISDTIDFEIKYGTKDRREELQYIIKRYCNEEIVSGGYLREKYNDYVETLKSKGVINY